MLAGEPGKRLTRYHLTLVPALHYLQFSHDQRIFQNLNVPQIITQVLHKHGIHSDVFTFHVSTRTSTVTRRDYDLKRPSLLLESRFTAEFTPELEDYRYPLPMKSEKHDKQLVRLALERHGSDYQLVEGASNQPTLRSG